MLVAIASGCVRTVRAWPPPLTPGTTVHVHFTAPRVIVFERLRVNDSVPGFRDVEGTVVAVNGDTLSLFVASDETNAGELTVMGRASIVLDPSTTVTFREIDGWKFAYALLSGVVLIFAALVMSGS